MNLFNIINTIKSTCISYKGVQEFNYGDIYEFENNKMRKYVNMNFTLQNLSNDADSDGMVVNGVLFCVDRMTDNGDNKLMVQSNCTDILKKVLVRLTENNLSWTLSGETYEVFSEKFADLCAGAWVTFSIEVGEDIICSDDEFVVKTLDVTSNGLYGVVGYDRILVNIPAIPVQSKTVTITENKTEVITPDSGYNLDKVTVDVDVPPTPVQSKTVTITENKTEVITPDSGYNLDKVTVDVDVRFATRLTDETRLAYSTWNYIPNNYDFSDCGDSYEKMFSNCTNLISIDFSMNNHNIKNIHNIDDMCYFCRSLTEIKNLDGYSIESAVYAFAYCNKLTSFGPLYLRSCTDATRMFYYCTGLKTLDITPSYAEEIDYMLYNCQNLTDLAVMDCTRVITCNNAFGDMLHITNVGGFINLGANFNRKTTVSFGTWGGKITVQSIQNIIDTVADISNNILAQGSALRFSTDMCDKCTDDMKQQIVNKGWTLSY